MGGQGRRLSATSRARGRSDGRLGWLEFVFHSIRPSFRTPLGKTGRNPALIAWLAGAFGAHGSIARTPDLWLAVFETPGPLITGYPALRSCGGLATSQLAPATGLRAPRCCRHAALSESLYLMTLTGLRWLGAG